MTERGDELETLTRVLVVSPHFDDAALSAWGLLSLPDCPTDVLTVFGGLPPSGTTTNADRACGFDDGVKAMLARRDEDQRALDPVASRHEWLPLLDSQYLQAPRIDSDAQVLVQAVQAWLDEHAAPDSDVAIAVPAGAGIHAPRATLRRPTAHTRPRGGPALAWLRALKHGLAVRKRRRALGGGAPAHPDHIFVRDTVLDAREHFGPVGVLLYEDLPYLWTLSADDEVSRLSERNHLTVRPLKIVINREQKQRTLSNYASQLTALDPAGRLHDPELLPPTERYWWLQPADQERSWL